MHPPRGLIVQNIHKSFGDKHALQDVSFDVLESSIVAVLGPSGSGKSTLLAVIAGLETADSGDVLWDQVSLAALPSHKRGFGLMFQDFALFPHMNVFDNIAFGLRMGDLPPGEIRSKVSEALNLVGLAGFEKRDVNTLSGGEQQRVALARSLAPRPRLLMLDEPLGSLDRLLREQLIDDLGKILHSLHQTALYVTHDQEEAFSLADQVVLMNSGRVEQTGTPQQIYTQPRSVFVASFLGLTNLLPGTLIQDGSRSLVRTALGSFPVTQPGQGEVTVLLRPDLIRLDGNGPCTLQGTLVENAFRGAINRLTVLVNDVPLQLESPSSSPLPAVGETVTLSFAPDQALQIFSET